MSHRRRCAELHYDTTCISSNVCPNVSDKPLRVTLRGKAIKPQMNADERG